MLLTNVKLNTSYWHRHKKCTGFPRTTPACNRIVHTLLQCVLRYSPAYHLKALFYTNILMYLPHTSFATELSFCPGYKADRNIRYETFFHPISEKISFITLNMSHAVMLCNWMCVCVCVCVRAYAFPLFLTHYIAW